MRRLRPPLREFSIAAVAVAAVSATVATAAWADSADGTNLSVVVISSSASPTSTATSTSTSTSSSTGTATSGGSVGTTDDPGSDGPTPTSSASTGSDQGLGGVLYVSGMAWAYAPSINPFDGSVELRFSVRNMYSKPLDSTVDMRVTNIFGGTVGAPVAVAVDDLKPGETRAVTATVSGLALWTVVTAHTTFTPPERVGDTTLTPISRDVVVWFVPWLLLLLTSAAGIGVLIRRRLLATAGPPMVPVAGEVES